MAEPRQHASAFADSLQAHLEGWRQGVDGSRHRWWDHWRDGIYRDYRDLAEVAVRSDGVRLHAHAAHLRSSQAFAFNLFLPFRQGGNLMLSKLLSAAIGADIAIDEVRFEWVPPGALLGEVDGESPTGDEPATAVDVALRGRLADGRGAAVLLEVKLSEADFTHCGGRKSRGNRRRDVCGSARLLFDEPDACYLRRPLRSSRDRRYWEIFTKSHGSVGAAFPGADREGPCPFAFGMQQPMRNLAIARGIEQDRDSGVDRVWFALCAHDDNPDVVARWDGWRGLLPEPAMAPYLTASAVVGCGEEEGLGEWAAWMRGRYRL